MAPIERQIAATVLFITLPLWIVPVCVWAGLWRVYRWVYEDVCGWEDYE